MTNPANQRRRACRNEAQPFVEPCSRGVIDAEPCPRELGREAPPRRRRMVLAACVLASSMAFIDATALPVALPRLRADFGADLASVQWVLNGYMLALASLTLIGGALADVYGKARMLGLGCVAVRSGVRGLRAGAFARLADRCPRRAGSGRSDRYPREPRPDRGHLSARGAEPGDRRMGGSVGSHHRRRSRPGRLAHRDLRLAIRVLDQPAARARRSGSSAGLCAEGSAASSAGST